MAIYPKSARAVICGISLILALYPGPTRAAEVDWSGAITQFLTDLATKDIPTAMAPLITLAQNADKLALAALYLQIRDKLLQLNYDILDANTSQEQVLIDRQIKGLEEAKAKVDKLHRELCPPPDKGKKESWFKWFFGLFAITSGGTSLPSSGGNQTYMLALLTPLPDPELAASDNIAFPTVSGVEEIETSPSSVDIEIVITNSGGEFSLEFNSFSATIPAFDVGGVSTGTNELTIHYGFGGATVVDAVEAEATFTAILGGTISNDDYGSSGNLGPSIPVVILCSGWLDIGDGEAGFTCDEAGVVPGIPGFEPGSPMVSAGAAAFFTLPGSLVVQSLGPDGVMLRDGSDNYSTSENSSDRLVDAVFTLQADVASNTPSSVTFSNASLDVDDQTGTLLSADVQGLTLDVATGSFKGIVDTTSGAVVDTAGSPLLAELLAHDPTPDIYVMNPGAAQRLYYDTSEFQNSSSLDFTTFVHVPEPSRFALLIFGCGMLLGLNAFRTRRRQ